MEEIDWGREATGFIFVFVIGGIAANVQIALCSRSRTHQPTKNKAFNAFIRACPFRYALFVLGLFFILICLYRDIALWIGSDVQQWPFNGIGTYTFFLPLAGWIWFASYRIAIKTARLTDNET